MIMPQLIINTYVSLMYELKKMETCRDRALVLWKKEFTGPRSHRGWETLV